MTNPLRLSPRVQPQMQTTLIAKSYRVQQGTARSSRAYRGFAREPPSKKMAIWEIVVPTNVIADYDSLTCLSNMYALMFVGTPRESSRISRCFGHCCHICAVKHGKVGIELADCTCYRGDHPRNIC